VPVNKEVSPPPAAAAAPSAWIPADKQHLVAPPPEGEKERKKPPSTVRQEGRPDRSGLMPGRASKPADTAIMDRPQAHTGGRWVYEASVKTTAQLAAPDPPPPGADALALISGPCRKAFLDIVNRRGSQGWELLQLAFHEDSVVMFWKRRE
jgi:hypothetical protein